MTASNSTKPTATADCPFTELFSILKRKKIRKGQGIELDYETQELKVIYRHVDNAMDILLQGLQTIGQMIGLVPAEAKKYFGLESAGFFIAVLVNLMEALNNFRADAEFVLKERGESVIGA